MVAPLHWSRFAAARRSAAYAGERLTRAQLFFLLHCPETVGVYVHSGPGSCDNEGCSDCEELVLHECGEMSCPDTAYMFKHGLNPLQMYSDPLHQANSHIPPHHGESLVGLTVPLSIPSAGS